MQLITACGTRIDRPSMSDLDLLLLKIRMTPYSELTEIQRLRLKLELELSHQAREVIRFRRFTEEAAQ